MVSHSKLQFIRADTTCTEHHTSAICPHGLKVPWKPTPSTAKLSGTFYWCCLAKFLTRVGSCQCQEHCALSAQLIHSSRAEPGGSRTPPPPPCHRVCCREPSSSPHSNNFSLLLRALS